MMYAHVLLSHPFDVSQGLDQWHVTDRDSQRPWYISRYILIVAVSLLIVDCPFQAGDTRSFDKCLCMYKEGNVPTHSVIPKGNQHPGDR